MQTDPIHQHVLHWARVNAEQLHLSLQNSSGQFQAPRISPPRNQGDVLDPRASAVLGERCHVEKDMKPRDVQRGQAEPFPTAGCDDPVDLRAQMHT